MGIFSKLFNSRDKPEEKVSGHITEIISSDDKGKPVYRDDVITHIKSELERRREQRRSLELQWQLNINFLNGNQHCDINVRSGTVEQYEVPYEGMENEVFNQIEPIFNTRVANLNKIGYSMTVKPRTSELDDIAKANVSTELLRYKQSVSNFTKFKVNLIHWSEIIGTAFTLCWWDNEKGDKAGRTKVLKLTTEGLPDESFKDLYDGDVEYGLLSAFEVFPEDIYKQEVSDQRSIITEQVLSADDIYDLYGIEVEGKALETYSISPVEGAGGFGYIATTAKMTVRTVENSEKVITYYERKNRRFPNGRMIILIGDELFYYGDLPYDEIPIIATKSCIVPGQFFGKSCIQNLIPLQRAYNGNMNTVHDYIKRLPVSTVVIEEGTIRDMDEFSKGLFEPGGILPYAPGRQKPTFMDLPDFPSDVANQIQKLRSDMEYAAGVSQLMVYGQNNGVTSGTAIQNLTEIDNTRLSVTGENIRTGIIETAKIWLKMYKKFASGYRALKVVGSNDSGDVLIWSGEDINSYDVEFDTENELIYSEEYQRNNYMSAYSAGMFTDSNGIIPESAKAEALELMKVKGYHKVISMYELQLQRANRENKLLKAGIAPVIEFVDNHNLHIEEHSKLMLQLEYQALRKSNPEICAAFEKHIREHMAFLQQDAQGAQDIQNLQGGTEQ